MEQRLADLAQQLKDGLITRREYVRFVAEIKKPIWPTSMEATPTRRR